VKKSLLVKNGGEKDGCLSTKTKEKGGKGEKVFYKKERNKKKGQEREDGNLADGKKKKSSLPFSRRKERAPGRNDAWRGGGPQKTTRLSEDAGRIFFLTIS